MDFVYILHLKKQLHTRNNYVHLRTTCNKTSGQKSWKGYRIQNWEVIHGILDYKSNMMHIEYFMTTFT
jgi:hypothetical protein